ncbi:hypothetical protein [Planctomicrobium piriforme]|uniref:Ribbon-helix-helix protein, copG family n=1 Tax=Planctomicrobium piriforme TaxID=1576369 RepID=A0A1I3JXH8_9PLAN|nr:hypothetical protein [Planctomicrobium piriforme]SFI64780.1 hypothetical protein SAMN05421753_11143 [Planctomicrobium piriforme]
MAKATIDSALYQRAEKAAAQAGYSSVDEFIAHAIETQLKSLEADDAERQVADQLRGLGYLDS